MEKATIYDYARMCRTNDCESCPFKLSGKGENVGCADFIIANTDKANEIILKWCEEHPVETRQDRFLKLYPNSLIDGDNVSHICPRYINKQFICQKPEKRCCDCRKEYWLAEVEE